MICDFAILRELRKHAKMSIADLAQKSGISASVISKLERNQSQAELDTLYKLARVFGLTLTDLINLAENRTSHSVEAESYTSGDFRFQRVDYGNVRLMHGFAPANGSLSGSGIHRDDTELCWVVKGKLKLFLGEVTHTVQSGESIQFDALLPHTYQTIEETEVLIVHLRKGKRF